jgi:rSAM/selenodomain-associated transferase 1
MEPVARTSSLPPAVAVMTKVPGVTVVKSRLHASLGEARATELYRCFLLDCLDAVATLREVTGVVAFTPPEAEALMRALAPPALRLVPQRGADLGERLSNILADLLGRGHAGAIAVDSDSPTLPMAYLAEAATVLSGATCDVVLGPCEDGGYYLVGLRCPQPALFEGIPWSTDAVFAMTVDRARARGLSVHVLPQWFDVDTEADLRRLQAELIASTQGPQRTSAFVRQLYRPIIAASSASLTHGTAAGEGHCP